MLFRFRWLQQEPFINNEQDGVGIFGLNLLVGAICTRQLKLQEHVGQAHILCFVTLFAGFHAEGAGHIGLTVRGKVILQPHGKEFFTWYSKHLFHYTVSTFLHNTVSSFLHPMVKTSFYPLWQVLSQEEVSSGLLLVYW